MGDSRCVRGIDLSALIFTRRANLGGKLAGVDLPDLDVVDAKLRVLAAHLRSALEAQDYGEVLGWMSRIDECLDQRLGVGDVPA